MTQKLNDEIDKYLHEKYVYGKCEKTGRVTIDGKIPDIRDIQNIARDIVRRFGGRSGTRRANRSAKPQ